MKMNLKEVAERLMGLKRIGEKTLPSALSFAIIHNTKVLEAEVKHLEDTRIKLCEQYAQKDEDGTPITEKYKTNGMEMEKYTFSKDSLAMYQEEYRALEEEVVDIDIHTAERTLVERCDQMERYDVPTLADIQAMDFMLK